MANTHPQAMTTVAKLRKLSFYMPLKCELNPSGTRYLCRLMQCCVLNISFYSLQYLTFLRGTSGQNNVRHSLGSKYHDILFLSINVHSLRLGGGFGGKFAQSNHLANAAAIAAYATGR